MQVNYAAIEPTGQGGGGFLNRFWGQKSVDTGVSYSTVDHSKTQQAEGSQEERGTGVHTV